jgi:predicted  nucleic acid-binding Zn-ribbon protein
MERNLLISQVDAGIAQKKDLDAANAAKADNDAKMAEMQKALASEQEQVKTFESKLAELNRVIDEKDKAMTGLRKQMMVHPSSQHPE